MAAPTSPDRSRSTSPSPASPTCPAGSIATTAAEGAQLLRRGDFSSRVADLAIDPAVVLNSAVQFFVVGAFARAVAAEGERGYRAVLLAAGGLARQLGACRGSAQPRPRDLRFPRPRARCAADPGRPVAERGPPARRRRPGEIGQAVVSLAGDETARRARYVDLTLGAWRPREAAFQLAASLDLALPPGDDSFSAAGLAAVHAEGAGDPLIMTAWQDAALIAPQLPGGSTVAVLAPRWNLPFRVENEWFFFFLRRYGLSITLIGDDVATSVSKSLFERRRHVVAPRDRDPAGRGIRRAAPGAPLLPWPAADRRGRPAADRRHADRARSERLAPPCSCRSHGAIAIPRPRPEISTRSARSRVSMTGCSPSRRAFAPTTSPTRRHSLLWPRVPLLPAAPRLPSRSPSAPARSPANRRKLPRPSSAGSRPAGRAALRPKWSRRPNRHATLPPR